MGVRNGNYFVLTSPYSFPPLVVTRRLKQTSNNVQKRRGEERTPEKMAGETFGPTAVTRPEIHIYSVILGHVQGCGPSHFRPVSTSMSSKIITQQIYFFHRLCTVPPVVPRVDCPSCVPHLRPSPSQVQIVKKGRLHAVTGLRLCCKIVNSSRSTA